MMNKTAWSFVVVVLFMSAAGLLGEKSGAEEQVFTGKVLEAQLSGNYMYLFVNVEGREFWISTIAKYLPEDISAGDTIEYSGGMLIQGFRSTAMNKTFDTMLLVSRIWIAGAVPVLYK